MSSNRGKKVYHITGIRYPYEKTWDKKKTFVNVDIEFVDVSLMNAIRRTIINNVEMIGIRTNPHDKSQITIYQNDTPLHNQFLSHRIGMVPIHAPNTDTFKYEDYELIIDVENETSYPKNIYSSDIKVRQISTNKLLSDTDTRKLFPADPITGKFILITILKPKYYNSDIKIQNIGLTNVNPEKLRLFLKSQLCKSIGCDEGGVFNQSTCSVYQNMVDPEKADLGLTKYMIDQRKHINDNSLSELTDEQLITRYNTSERDRHFYTNEEDEPIKFIFKIETIGVIPPLVIMYKGFKRLKSKLQNFITNLSKNNEDIITIVPSKHLNNCYEYVVKNEDDTLGNLIHSEISSKFCNYGDKNEKVNYVGYIKTHPLIREIKLSIQTKHKMDENAITKDVIIPSCESIINVIDKLSQELEKSPQLATELKNI
jgi:DNA-directed RNA polymerase subunit L